MIAVARDEDIFEKIKVTDLILTWEMVGGKPYYSILYKKLGDTEYNEGFSSYDYNIVLNYREEYFDLCLLK